MKRFSGALAALVCLPLMLYVVTASAQIDLTGTWAAKLDEDYQIRFSGPDFVDYLGIPLNKEGLAGALSYTTSTVAELHRECEPWPVHYLLLGPFGARIWPTTDPASGQVVAWHLSGSIDREEMTIWVDGRPQPGPQGLNTFSGFTTGQWQGDTLVTTTTHIKDGFLTRNGVPSSDRETLTMFITRHEQLLTITAIVQDPVYLSAPYILSRSWMLDATMPIAFPAATCTPEEELDTLAHDHVPSYLPGKNPVLNFMTQQYHIPLEAAEGGAQTMFPEYSQKLKNHYAPAGYCTRYCCGTGTDFNFVVGVLMCKHGP